MITESALKRFLAAYPVRRMSAAKLESEFFKMPALVDAAMKRVGLDELTSEKDKETAELIEAADTPEALVRLMRREMNQINREALKKKLLENEAAVTPLIQEKCMRVLQDVFIETALHFFLYCQADPTDFVRHRYDEFRSEYLKSQFCLILGFRGNMDDLVFLMEETGRFRENYPEESYEQGPLLAVYEIWNRHVGEI